MPLILSPKAGSKKGSGPCKIGLKLLAGGKAGSSPLILENEGPIFVGALKIQAGEPLAKSTLLLRTRKYVPASRKKNVGIVRKAWSKNGGGTVSENSAKSALPGVPGPMAFVTCTFTFSGSVAVFAIKMAISVIVAPTGKVNSWAKNWVFTTEKPPLGTTGAPESTRVIESALATGGAANTSTARRIRLEAVVSLKTLSLCTFKLRSEQKEKAADFLTLIVNS
jgi:hypothetical protein